MKKELGIGLEKTLSLRREEIYQGCYWNTYMYDENGDPREATDEEIENNAQKRYQLFLDLEGPDRLFKCKEEFESISLREELEAIRYSETEKVLILAIMNGSIVDKLLFEGQKGHIDLSDYSINNAFPFIKKWKEKGALILNYHNHPIGVAARPSNDDIMNLTINSDIGKYFFLLNCSSARNKILNTLEGNGLSGFGFDDWGVVTEFDFFSAHQKEDELIGLFEESKNAFACRVGIR